MSINGILFYCARAARFALLAGIVWTIGYLVRRQKTGLRVSRRGFALRLTLVCYLAGLVEITALRGLVRAGRSLQLLPLAVTTLGDLQAVPRLYRMWTGDGAAPLEAALHSVWPFFYHVAGNLVWFVPFGLLAPRVWPRLRRLPQLALAAAGLSAGIELGQFVLATGATDIDDLLLNTLGAVLGWQMGRGLEALCRAAAAAKAQPNDPGGI